MVLKRMKYYEIRIDKINSELDMIKNIVIMKICKNYAYRKTNNFSLIIFHEINKRGKVEIYRFIDIVG